MNPRRLWGKCMSGWDLLRLRALPSYSQAGEDMVVNYLFQTMGIKEPTYLDIGANLPDRGNNTFLFYRKGAKGVCIEPNKQLCKQIQKKRPRDLVLNIGIGLQEASFAPFYFFPGNHHSWSTFSETDARIKEKDTGVVPEVMQVPLQPVNLILEKYFDSCPNFISLDVEGLDLAILQSMDFAKYRPEAICVETVSFSIHNEEKKLNDIIDFMSTKGYIVYGDTHINTIFCKSELFKK